MSMKRREFIASSVGLTGITLHNPLLDNYAIVNAKIQESNLNSSDEFDVIVLGVGSMGAATIADLAKRGLRVLGLEQFSISHEMGSHHGQSRIIRKAYYETPAYVPLLQRAYQNWAELEKVSGEQVYFKTGVLYAGKYDHHRMKSIHESATKYNITVDSLSKQDVQKRFPQFNIPDGHEILFEPDAGFLTPEKAILLYAEQALKNGAIIKTQEGVLHWEKKRDLIFVTTKFGIYKAKKMVITAGAWASKAIASMAKILTVTRQAVGWVIPTETQKYELGNLPCWLIVDDVKPGGYYGFPVLPVGKFGGPIGLKLAHHYPGKISDPDNLDRSTNKADEADILFALNKFLPGAYKQTHTIKTCSYTNAPDKNFIIDFLPGFGTDVTVATGFSGHGFKFASVIGEVMADLVIAGKTTLPIDFLNVDRFNI
jgi:sarcosine oxidase